MILGASLHDIVEFALVFLVGMGTGIGYILLFVVRSGTKSNILRFIFDFCYAIIVAGVFGYTMLNINMLDIRYYHIMALMMGILLVGVLPVATTLGRYEDTILRHVERLRTRIRESRLYHIIKK